MKVGLNITDLKFVILMRIFSRKVSKHDSREKIKKEEWVRLSEFRPLPELSINSIVSPEVEHQEPIVVESSLPLQDEIKSLREVITELRGETIENAFSNVIEQEEIENFFEERVSDVKFVDKFGAFSDMEFVFNKPVDTLLEGLKSYQESDDSYEDSFEDSFEDEFSDDSWENVDLDSEFEEEDEFEDYELEEDDELDSEFEEDDDELEEDDDEFEYDYSDGEDSYDGDSYDEDSYDEDSDDEYSYDTENVEDIISNVGVSDYTLSELQELFIYNVDVTKLNRREIHRKEIKRTIKQDNTPTKLVVDIPKTSSYPEKYEELYKVSHVSASSNRAEDKYERREFEDLISYARRVVRVSEQEVLRQFPPRELEVALSRGQLLRKSGMIIFAHA